MGKLALLFLILAGAVAYDAIVYDGRYSKTAWAEIRAAGASIEDRVGRLGDGTPVAEPRVERNASGT
jgi:hypothetical protein